MSLLEGQKAKALHTYGPTDRPTDRQTDTRSYRVALSRLKKEPSLLAASSVGGGHRVFSLFLALDRAIASARSIVCFLFLDASSHLYNRVCPSVRPSVGRSVGPSVGDAIVENKAP